MRDPGLDQARLGLAEMLRISHHNAEAAQEYATYMARKPEDPLGYLGAGQNATEMGDSEDAARWLDRAIELAPRNPVILAARATVEVRNHRFAEALDYLDRAVQADPFDHSNRFQRMIILTRLGKKVQADAELRVLERIRKDQEEFARIRDGLLASPQDAGLRSEAARWLMAHGHEEEAIDWAKLVLAAEPSHPAMNRLLADYYRRRGQLGLANFHEASPAPDARALREDASGGMRREGMRDSGAPEQGIDRSKRTGRVSGLMVTRAVGVPPGWWGRRGRRGAPADARRGASSGRPIRSRRSARR